MLTGEDDATIRNAILKRLDAETGVAIADIKIENTTECVKVGVWAILTDIGEVGDVKSFFDLPPEFEHKHLINEIDQVAEHIKVARKQLGPFALFNPGNQHREMVLGTGLRGLWSKHGAA